MYNVIDANQLIESALKPMIHGNIYMKQIIARNFMIKRHYNVFQANSK